MKKHFVILVFTSLSFVGFAQNSAVSPSYSFDIRKKIEPPILEIKDLKFIDEDGNGAIDANEHCYIEFILKNSGKGDALNLKANISVQGNSDDIIFNNSTPLSTVAKEGGERKIKLDITSKSNTVDGHINFDITVIEPNGFNADPIQLQINTRKLLTPDIQVVDYKLFSENGTSNLTLKKPFSLELLVQNLGQGVAKNVKLDLSIPENVFLTSGDANTQVGVLQPGEKKSLVFEMIMNASYVGSTLQVKANLLESYGKYAKNWQQSFTLNQTLSQQKIVVDAKPINNVKIEQASLSSDVDKEIPIGLPTNTKKYALIIGCEDYAKYQTGLEKEVNVDFASNDAKVFADYAKTTLGFPDKQVALLIDPTSSQIKQQIEKLAGLIEIENGSAEILFYYSGHGLPDNATNAPYLIPVDVNGNSPQDGISLSWVYQKLGAKKSAKCVVVLDACFSGGARNKELVAMKGVKIKPKMDQVPGNLVVFTSSKGTETSAVYREKQHGYFTYFLLKNLKQNKGELPFGEMFSDVNKNVSKEVLINISKEQHPDVISGSEIGSSWLNLKW
jgi:hypothetical protein